MSTTNQNLTYVIVTAHTIAKSRTGGVIARLLSRVDLELVAAQMIVPDDNFIHEYAASFRSQESRNLNTAGELLANYIEQKMGPADGRRHRFLLLIFRGENACRKLSEICGPISPENPSLEAINGETIRATYGDFIVDHKDPEKVIYFEPAILTPRLQEVADDDLALFARHFRTNENIVHSITYLDPSKIEHTLVIIKPDNWSYASSKPGSIIDMFSRTGLRIVGIKVFRFSMNQALDFYGPVEGALKDKLAPIFGLKAKESLEKEFGFPLSTDTGRTLGESFGKEYAREEFYKIISFMSGRRPDTCSQGDEGKPGSVKCMILIYEGENAVQKIRDVLGPTDPLKAPGGTVRREFGSSVMVNTAHASDSVQSCEREMKIVKINENSLVALLDEYLGSR